MPRTPLPAALVAASCLTPLPLAAQTIAPGALGWLSLFKPEIVAQQFLQFGIMALRSQVDLQYEDMALDLRLGQVALTDVVLWPAPDWDETYDCQVSVDRLVLRSAPIDTPETMRLKLQASGVSMNDICLPPDARQPLAMLGQDGLSLPRVTLDASYDIPSAGAHLTFYTEISEVLAATLTADLSYLWIDARVDPDNPDPVAYLENATLVLENHGVWEALSPQLPPPFTNPDQGGAVLSGLVAQGLSQMNRDAAGPDAEGDTGALSDAQNALVGDLAEVWPDFLETPARLVLETGLAPGEDIFLDVFYYEDNPSQIFEDLRPRLTLAPAAARRTMPAALVAEVRAAAQAGDTAAIAADTLRTVGLALITGDGAPRDRLTGLEVLSPLAEAGDGAAALALSEAFEATAPSAAYTYALVAAANGASGAAARLDRLETVLPFADVLALQDAATGDVQHPVEALDDVALIREQAILRLTGRGALRSYAIAALWASLGAATGDAESADILASIDERVRLSGPEAQDAWAAVEADVSALAMEAWLGMDLPARFGGN